MYRAARRSPPRSRYKAGREAFQGETLDFCSLDEEPPAEVYTECLTRTNIGSGPVWLTFTPLLGMSEVVRRFLLEKSIDRSVTSDDDRRCGALHRERKENDHRELSRA